MADCSETSDFKCLPYPMKAIFWFIVGLLFVSLFWNIFCCAFKCRSGKKSSQRTTRKSQSSRQMADNPIYGNITCTTQVLYTEVDASHSSCRDWQRVNPIAQDCYANLTQAPNMQYSLSSSQAQSVQYSDIVDVVEVAVEKQDETITDEFSTMSQLYASVQTQRSKAILTAEDGKDYANHL